MRCLPDHPRRRRATHARAFSLVELLVVIGIVIVLLAILLPALSSSGEEARRVECQSNLGQLAISVMSYASYNNDWFPAGASLYLQANNDWIFWQPNRNLEDSAIRPYIASFHDGAILRCPSDDWASRTTNPNPAYPAYSYSYTLNEWISPSPTSPPLALPALRLDAMNNPSGKILLVEESPLTIDDGLWAPASGNWLAIRHDRPGISPDTVPHAGYPIPNPTRRGNAVFLDGHVEYVPRNYAQNPQQFDPHE